MSDLPPVLLAEVLWFLPQQHRLCTAALVSRSWAKAAVHATLDLELDVKADTAPALEAWMGQHGEQLQFIHLKGPGEHADAVLPLQLPLMALNNLCSLDLKRVALPAIPSPSASPARSVQSWDDDIDSAMTPLLPELERLHLTYCNIASMGCLVRLASSSWLTSLQLFWPTFTTPIDLQAQAAVCTLLRRLPHLRRLTWRLPGTCKWLSQEALGHVAAMEDLEDLSLSVYEGAGSCRAQLAASLTRLSLSNAVLDDGAQSAGTAHASLTVQHTTRLQQLQLLNSSLLPAILYSMPQLRILDLEDCYLLPYDSSVSQHYITRPAGVVAFLDAVQRLTQLQHLAVEGMSVDCSGVPLEAFAALTASTKLTALVLAPSFSGVLLVDGALQYMLPAGRQLPHLQRLYVEGPDDDDGSGAFMSRQDLACIINDCPALQDLSIGSAMQPGADLSPLLQLPSSCLQLCIGGVAFSDAAAAVVGQLTQLTDLVVSRSPELTDAGVKQLTALTALNELAVQDCDKISKTLATPLYCSIKTSDSKVRTCRELLRLGWREA